MAGPPTSASTSLNLDDDTPVFVISVAAQLAGMHPQTLRQYDRIGLVSPGRSRGRGRRYSARDVATLREVQRLSQDEGVSLAGIKRILELDHQVAALRGRIRELEVELERARTAAGLVQRVFAAGPGGDVVSVSPGRRPSRSAFGSETALVVWRPAAGQRSAGPQVLREAHGAVPGQAGHRVADPGDLAARD